MCYTYTNITGLPIIHRQMYSEVQHTRSIFVSISCWVVQDTLCSLAWWPWSMLYTKCVGSRSELVLLNIPACSMQNGLFSEVYTMFYFSMGNSFSLTIHHPTAAKYVHSCIYHSVHTRTFSSRHCAGYSMETSHSKVSGLASVYKLTLVLSISLLSQNRTELSTFPCNPL